MAGKAKGGGGSSKSRSTRRSSILKVDGDTIVEEDADTQKKQTAVGKRSHHDVADRGGGHQEEEKMTMKVAATDDPMPADATGSGGVKRVKLDSIDLSQRRKSGRGQKMRKSDQYLQLEHMKFPDYMIETALRICPDNLEGAIEYILTQTQIEETSTQVQTQVEEKEEEKESTQAPASVRGQGGVSSSSSSARRKAKDEPVKSCDLFDDMNLLDTSSSSAARPTKMPPPLLVSNREGKSTTPCSTSSAATTSGSSSSGSHGSGNHPHSSSPAHHKAGKRGRSSIGTRISSPSDAPASALSQPMIHAEVGGSGPKKKGEVGDGAMSPPRRRSRRDKGEGKASSSIDEHDDVSNSHAGETSVTPASVGNGEEEVAPVDNDDDGDAVAAASSPMEQGKEEQGGEEGEEGQEVRTSASQGSTSSVGGNSDEDPLVAAPPPPSANVSADNEEKVDEQAGVCDAKDQTTQQEVGGTEKVEKQQDETAEGEGDNGRQSQNAEAKDGEGKDDMAAEDEVQEKDEGIGEVEQADVTQQKCKKPEAANETTASQDVHDDVDAFFCVSDQQGEGENASVDDVDNEVIVEPEAESLTARGSEGQDFDYLLSQVSDGRGLDRDVVGGQMGLEGMADVGDKDQAISTQAMKSPQPLSQQAKEDGIQMREKENVSRTSANDATEDMLKVASAPTIAALKSPFRSIAANKRQNQATSQGTQPPLAVPPHPLRQSMPDDASSSRVPVGFQTGRGRHVAVSEESLANVDHLFRDDQGPSAGPSMQQRQHEQPPLQTLGATMGFQTGRGRHVAVSEESLAKVDHLFREEGGAGAPRQSTSSVQLQQPPSVMPGATMGLQTGRGRRVAVSEESLAKVDHLFRGEQGGAGPSMQAQPQPYSVAVGGASMGFQTGRGRHVAVSEESLAKVDHLFREEQGGGAVGPSSSMQLQRPSVMSGGAAMGFQTGRGRQVAVSEESLAKVDHLFREEEGTGAGLSSMKQPQKPPPPAMGFQAGRCRHVAVSEESLAKVDHLFRDEERTGAGPSSLKQPQQPPAATGGATMGFQTGRGRHVAVSEENLAKVDHLFRDEQKGGAGSSSMEPPQLPTSGATMGFQTGRGRQVAVSEESLARVDHLFRDEQGPAAGSSMQAQPQPFHEGPSMGFQTGRGRQVAISEESLARVDHLFREEVGPAAGSSVHLQQPLSAMPKGASVGFQTGRGRHVAVSEESLAKVDHLFRDEQGGAAADQPQLPPAGPMLFQTGTGHQVSVSEESIAKVDHLFREEGPSARAPSTIHPQSQPSEEHHQEDAAVGLLRVKPSNQVRSVESGTKDDEADNSGIGQGNDMDTFQQPEVEPLAESSTVENEENHAKSTVYQAPSVMQWREDIIKDLELKDLHTLAGGEGKRLKMKSLGVHPRAYTAEALAAHGLKSSTIAVTSNNAHYLRFLEDGLPASCDDCPELLENANNTQSEICLPTEQVAKLTEDLMSTMDSHRKPPVEKWIANHYRLIVWKLASLEKSFPDALGGRYLTNNRVIQQLRYRYHKEMVEGHRPALRIIMNGDSPADRLMILCVSRIFPCPPSKTNVSDKGDNEEGKTEASPADGSQNPPQPQPILLRVELTDGWYCIDAQLDAHLSKQIINGRIRVGSKMAVCNASLQGTGGGIDPLEVKFHDVESRPYLRLLMNSTRLAKWNASLGFQKARTLTLPISGLVHGGGQVPCLEVIVLRRYPNMYSERIQGRNSVRYLTEAEEHDAQQAHESSCQARMEKLLEEAMNQVDGRREGAGPRPVSDEDDLSLVARGRRRAELEAKQEEARRQVMEDPSFQRSSSTFFKVKVCSIKTVVNGEHQRVLSPDFQAHTIPEIRSNLSIVTIWAPLGAFDEALQEGNHVMLYSAVAPPHKGKGPPPSTLRLTISGGSAQVRAISTPAPLHLLNYAHYKARHVVPSIRHVRHTYDAMAGLSVSYDFDCVGGLLRSCTWHNATEGKGGGSSKPRTTRHFFTDPSGCVLCVEKCDYNQVEDNEVASPERGVNEVWSLNDLTFQSYDARTDTLMCRTTSGSSLRKSLPRSRKEGYLRQAMEDVTAWTNSKDGKKVLEQEWKRLRALMKEYPQGVKGGGGEPHRYSYRKQIRGSLYQLEERASLTTATGLGDDDVLKLTIDTGREMLKVFVTSQYSLRCLVKALLSDLPETPLPMSSSSYDHHEGGGGGGGEEEKAAGVVATAAEEDGSHMSLTDLISLNSSDDGRNKPWSELLHAHAVALELNRYQHYWGSLTLELVVQRQQVVREEVEEGGEEEEEEEDVYVVMDVRAQTAIQQGHFLLRELLE